MSSSDERREVAARLRSCVPEINGTYDFAMYLNHWIGVGSVNVDGPFSVKSDRRTAEMTLEKLADLIDPTCEVESVDSTGGLLAYNLSCGHTAFALQRELKPTYCPYCGARVVGNDDN